MRFQGGSGRIPCRAKRGRCEGRGEEAEGENDEKGLTRAGMMTRRRMTMME